MTNSGTYCEEAVAGPYGIKNQCVGTVDIPLGPFAPDDYDGDGIGDACDDDRDGDGISNEDDPDPDEPDYVQWDDRYPVTNITPHVFIERRMESVAILRCLGVGGRTLLAVYLVQAVTVGLAGSALGAALGAVVQLVLPRVLSGILPVDVAWSPPITAQRALGQAKMNRGSNALPHNA